VKWFKRKKQSFKRHIRSQ